MTEENQAAPSGQETEYIVDKLLWHGNDWHQPGTRLSGSVLGDELSTKYLGGGFIVPAEEHVQRENPRAAHAEGRLSTAQNKIRELEVAQADIAGLLRQFGDEDGAPATVAQAVASVKLLQGESLALTGALTLLGGKDGPLAVEDLPVTLRGLLSDRQTLALVQKELTTLRALHPVAPGTDLPTSFLRRGPLLKAGLGTYEALQGKTAEQLDAVEGIEKENAVKIVTLVEAWTAKQSLPASGEPQAGAQPPASGEQASTLPEGTSPPSGEPGDAIQGG